MRMLIIWMIVFCVLYACEKPKKNVNKITAENKSNDTTQAPALKVDLDKYIGKKVKTLIDDLSKYYEKDQRFKYFYKSGQDDISDSITIDRCAFIFNFSEDEYVILRIHIDIDSAVVFPHKVEIKTEGGYYSMENKVDVNLFYQEIISDIYPIFRKKKMFEDHLLKEIEEFTRLKNLK